MCHDILFRYVCKQFIHQLCCARNVAVYYRVLYYKLKYSSHRKGQRMPDLINIKEEPVKSLLSTLLQDKTTKKNIIWATDIYSDLGPGYSDKNQLTTELLLGRFTLQPRIAKTLEEQQQRTRTKAEVMTPVWICNRMNNYLDEQWFDRCDVFNHENEDHSWEATAGSIVFNANSWQSYVDSRRLEITCGEAPYLVSRYDTTTGELISPLSLRIGILDRKLRVVNENTETEEEWITWAERAIQSSYGYEYQGDSLLIARINILLTYWEYYLERWKKEPPKTILQHIGNIITWNIWQMDGLKDTVPLGKPFEEYHQISMLDLFSETETVDTEMTLPCQIHNWREKSTVLFMDCKRRKNTMRKNLFDFVIGNPPYQDTGIGENSKAPSVYNHFLDEAYAMADVVEMIHPARFLFNAGDTDKKWNQKMLNDPHFRVLLYEPNSANIFSNTDIKGGVAITYRDTNSDYEPIGIFFKQPLMNSIFHKIVMGAFQPFSDLVFSPVSFKFTEKMHKEHPNLKDKLSKGNEYEVKTNVVLAHPN